MARLIPHARDLAAAARRAGTDPSSAVMLYTGEAAFREGDPVSGVFLVRAGALRLVRHGMDGRRRLLGFVCAGEWLGTALAERHRYAGEAITPCRLEPASSISKDEAERTLAAQRLRGAEDQIMLLNHLCALEKVCAFLIMMEPRLRRSGGAKNGAFDLPMDRRDIADFLALTVETVSRKLTLLRGAGIIDLPGPRRVRILDRVRLRRYAGDEG